MELLDVEHQVDNFFKGESFTNDFVKLTAIDSCFLHEQSHHPPTIYKSNGFGEMVRLQLLNELQKCLHLSLQQLQTKCFKSNFDMKTVDNILYLVKTRTDRFKSKTNDNYGESKKVIWATSFTNCIALTPKEK